jgi:hypothetical protein
VATNPGDDTLNVDEGQVRSRLRRADFVVRESVRDALVERWGGDGWLSWLRTATLRMADAGSVSFDESSRKWVAVDRKDRIVLSEDGQMVVAAFPGSHSHHGIQEAIAAGTFTMSPTVTAMLEERLGAQGPAAGAARIAQMAQHGTVTWRDDATAGGWRLAADGDVAMFDPRVKMLLKFFWSRLDARPSACVDDVRAALADGSLRPARRLEWRLERAWGPNWSATLQSVCTELAVSGTVDDTRENAFEVTGCGVSLLVSRDAQVIVSARVNLTGDPAAIQSAVLAGEVVVCPDVDKTAPRYRAPSAEVYSSYARALAAVDAPQATSTHWTLRLGGVEVSLGTDGTVITGIMTRPTDVAAEAAERIRAGVFFTRPTLSAEMVAGLAGWSDGVVADNFTRTPKGWTYHMPTGDVFLDGSATLVVGFEPVAQ